MTVELSSEDGPMFLEFEVYGPLTTEDLTQIVKQLDDDNAIQKISIEIGIENPATLKLPELTHRDATRFVERKDDDMNEETAESPPDQLSITGEDNQPGDSTQTSTAATPQLQTGGNPLAILRVVDHHDGWLRTEEIAEAIPSEWDVSEQTLGSNLWSLDDRGLVEKRPYEEDNRQKEYRVTDTGERALKRALERAGKLEPIP